MTEVTHRTNGDRADAAVVKVKTAGVALMTYAREHPDEVAVAAVPWLLMVWATRRHDLTLTERVIVSEGGYWLGVLALKEYRAWKARPTRPLPKLRKVS